MNTEMKPGIYPGKVLDYGIFQGKDITKSHAKVVFEVSNASASEVLPEPVKFEWNGYFTGGAKEITMKTLVDTFGFNGASLAELNDGIGSKKINEEVSYDLDLQIEEYQGKQRLKIKYVNLPGASRRAERLSRDEAMLVVAGLNLDAELIALRQKSPAKPAGAPPPKLDTTAPVPF